MKLSKKQSYLIVFLLFVIWRIFLFIISLISPLIINAYKINFPYLGVISESGLPYWIWPFAGFDGVHYLRLAREGYANLQFTQAFLPIYPILIKLTSIITFGNFLMAGLLISNLAFLAGLLLFYKLVEKNFNGKTAIWSTVFLLSFPTSFYFGSVYTEGLFFLLIMASFYLYGQKKIWPAVFIGSLAAATRLAGVFLSFVLIREFKVKNIIPLAIIPLGLIAYMIYLKIFFNNALYFLTAQSAFGQSRSAGHIVLLPQVFWRYLKIIATIPESLALFSAVYELTSVIFVITLLIMATKSVKREWLVFSWLAILTPTLTGTFTSMPRYIVIAFPIYIVLAKAKSDAIKIILIVLLTSMLTLSTILFTRGYWVA